MRKIHDFHGGIHPPENKRQSTGRGILDAGLPPRLVLPLAQHSGAPATPVAGVGERVLKGQPLAEPAGLVSAYLHAPTSGTVVAIEDRVIPHPSGHSAPCIIIDSDGRDEWLPLQGLADWENADLELLLERIRSAGVVGLGGAGFPSAVKLSPRPGRHIDTLIINGTECEPYITADDMLMRERADRIVAGSRIIAQLVKPREILIGVEDNKPEALAALRRAVTGSAIEVVEFPTKYPSGGEKQLIELLTGREVPSGGLPADIGVVCQNVGTAAAVYEAIVHGRPLISRVTTVTGEAVSEPGNFEVLLGTPMRYLLERAGFRPQDCERLIMGGPMMGFTLPDPDVPVVKTTNCILAPSRRELPAPPPPQPCIRCGLCAEACPATLLPQQLFWFSQGREFDKAEQHNLFDCIECGACSWVCPSNIPLVQYYRAAKAEILHLRRQQEKAEHSRLRFEARQQRLEREQAEKEARRAARKRAAEQRARDESPDAGAEADPVQAAIERARAKKAAQQSAGSSGQNAETLERAVISARKRLDTATARLEQAQAGQPELVEAMQTAVDRTRAKLEAAERALGEFHDGGQSPPKTEAPDPAAAAIARAMAAREAEAALGPEEKLRRQLTSLRQRLEKSETRLAASREAEEDAKIVEALEASAERLRERIAAVEAELSSAENA